METIVSDLVRQFEQGSVSRRELIAGLTMLVTGGGAARAATPQATAFRSAGIDHISIQVTDLSRSVDFYETVFGLSILNEDRENEIVRMGRTRVIVSLHRKPPTGIVDHYAIAIEEFDRDAVVENLARHGLTADQNLDFGFHVRDPEGIPVQIVGS